MAVTALRMKGMERQLLCLEDSGLRGTARCLQQQHLRSSFVSLLHLCCPPSPVQQLHRSAGHLQKHTASCCALVSCLNSQCQQRVQPAGSMVCDEQAPPAVAVLLKGPSLLASALSFCSVLPFPASVAACLRAAAALALAFFFWLLDRPPEACTDSTNARRQWGTCPQHLQGCQACLACAGVH